MSHRRLAATIMAFVFALALPLLAAEKKAAVKEPPKEEEKTYSTGTFTGLEFRSIGPAVKSGRIADLAVDPSRPSRFFVAAASGGVWRTENGGTTWKAVFEGEGSYSIGCVALDQKNPSVVWVGTGENNSQRSVGYGDGIYRSRDGGESWERMGLEKSEHIAKILVDPRDSQVVYAACQGPLWSAGGERGLYKTTDGGKSWKAVLTVSENTGVTDVILDPRNPDTLLAASYQRRRHVWGIIHGGPESALHKSDDGGATWRKVTKGLPEKVELGRIGLAVAPSDPDVVYAVVEAQDKKGGFFRSADRGETWEKRGDYVPESAQYYNEIFVDPKDADRVYVMDTWMRVTEDGGRTFRKVGERFKHVDNHALWIDPLDTRHLLAGCDGGLYDTFDRGATWRFYGNLPITQFYRVSTDDARPFYNIYGGTQDNNSLGGPSRTDTAHGITNADWFVTIGGDGFKTQVDPTDPNLVYSQSQYGGLGRYDRRTGEVVDIQPLPSPGEEALRWNWDSPLLLSRHNPARLFFACQRVFLSEDRGSSWRSVSPDLTRHLDRSTLKMMGRIWSVDSVARFASTSVYGNIVSLAESPRLPRLLYAGTDDGVVQVTEDLGATWRKVESFPGVPERAYVSALVSSRHDDGTVYAAFDNHKEGNFRPYLLKSADRGRTWSSLASGLPEHGTVYALAEDPVVPGMLYVGTEFGLWLSRPGAPWVRLKGGLPTVAVRDIVVQEREDDLVLGTFGRGFYVLDDLAPLRKSTPEALETTALLFPVRRAWMFIPRRPLGLKEKADQGDAFFTAPNPPFGAAITYYLKEDHRNLHDERREKEKSLNTKGADVPFPGWEALRAEDREEEPAAILTVRDEEGNVVRRLSAPATKGFHRVAWDLRYPASDPVRLDPPTDYDPWNPEPEGPMAAPGTYTVSLALRARGKVEPLAGPVSFDAVPLSRTTLPAADQAVHVAFERKVARLQRAVLGSGRVIDEAKERLALLKKGIDDTPAAAPELALRARVLEQSLLALEAELKGDETLRKRNEATSPSLVDRVQGIVYGHWNNSGEVPGDYLRMYGTAADLFDAFLPRLTALVETDLRALEADAEKAGAPWTPGRVPRWSKE